MKKLLLVVLSVLFLFSVSQAKTSRDERGITPGFDFIGMYYDPVSTRSIHVCIGRETDEIHVGISLPGSPYFITVFGRGYYTGNGQEVNGVDMYYISNAGYSFGSFNFTRYNDSYWTGAFNPSSGPLVGTVITFTASQITNEEPEEEFCTKPTPDGNSIYGIWEFLEQKNGQFHHVKANFFSQTAAETLLGCWGYTDTALEEFAGIYNGTILYENRGWVGTRIENGDLETSAVFFLRVGNTGSETKVVGYYLLPGEFDPQGYQIISNSATLQNIEGACPIVGTECTHSSSSESSGNQLSNVITTFKNNLL